MKKDTVNFKKYSKFIKSTEQIRSKLNERTFEHFKSKSMPVYCFARLRRENEWFRARIIQVVSVMEENNEQSPNARNKIRVRVFFVDYGDYDMVTLDDIYPIDEKFIQRLPFQVK